MIKPIENDSLSSLIIKAGINTDVGISSSVWPSHSVRDISINTLASSVCVERYINSLKGSIPLSSASS